MQKHSTQKHLLSLLFTLPYGIPSRKTPSTDVIVEGSKMVALIGVLTIGKASYHSIIILLVIYFKLPVVRPGLP
ncbi:hypothetical protein BYT27DRAFT_6955430 [Phlegmacium glaucopus]|nr:hypothetical protein BYT27DRAFT_6955430 [Phlegmacium glaucopus]